MLISSFLFASTFLTGIFAAPVADALDVASHTPLVARNSNKRGKDLLGATYFITNRPAQTIIISGIKSNGSLSFAKEVPTGGAGGFAVFMNGVDVLFSQDSVLVADNVPSPHAYFIPHLILEVLQMLTEDALCGEPRG